MIQYIYALTFLEKLFCCKMCSSKYKFTRNYKIYLNKNRNILRKSCDFVVVLELLQRKLIA